MNELWFELMLVTFYIFSFYSTFCVSYKPYLPLWKLSFQLLKKVINMENILLCKLKFTYMDLPTEYCQVYYHQQSRTWSDFTSSLNTNCSLLASENLIKPEQQSLHQLQLASNHEVDKT